MNEKKTGLEAFVERHRADFDVFEPRADLWEAIEDELNTPAAAEEAPLRVVPLFAAAAPETPAAPMEAPRATDPAAVRSARPYGIAAALAALLMVGGWFWQHQAEPTTWQRTGKLAASTAVAPEPADAFGPSASLTATPAAAGPEQRLAGAVQRMESYYTAQIAERQQELRALDREAPAPGAEWQQELRALDSTYQQLRAELYRNPEPDVVLDAMDRNLQIRLDLLNQQVRTREQIRTYHSQPNMVADNRQTP